MVQLILYSPKGNQGVRYFPYSGYLGLTPVKVEGVVRTKVEHDGKLLPAKFITVSVKCCESRLGRVGTLHSNTLVDYSQVLWSKPDDRDYSDVGDFEFPFRITLPPDVAGHSTLTFPDFRAYWRIEAVIQHIPISGVGSRNIKHFELPLIRFDLPQNASSSLSSQLQLGLQTNKPRAPRIRYSLITPAYPVGPLDLVSILFRLQPQDSHVSIRSASVIIERRIELNDVSAPPSPHPTGTVTVTLESNSQSSSRAGSIAPDSPNSSTFEIHTASLAASSSRSLAVQESPSVSSGDTTKPLIHHIRTPTPPPPIQTLDIPLKTISTSVAGVESSGRFTQDTDGVWSKTLTLQWPATKSSSRWTIGETVQSELVTVRFFVKAKIIISSPGGTESIELAERELIVVPTNDTQRQLAVSNYNEQLCNTSSVPRAQSKSTRRLNIECEPLPASISSTTSHSISTRPEHSCSLKPASASALPPSRGKARSMRRPHTSAGPRDKSYGLGNGYAAQVQPDDDERHKSLLLSPEPETTVAARGFSKNTGAFGQKWLVSPRLGTSASGGSASGHDAKVREVVNRKGKGRDVMNGMEVRAWEEELQRIESESRRSTASMFGFAFKRKRITEQGFDRRPVVGRGAS